jgi:hypothetical protein
MMLRMQSKSAPGRDRAVEHIMSEVRDATRWFVLERR